MRVPREATIGLRLACCSKEQNVASAPPAGRKDRCDYQYRLLTIATAIDRIENKTLTARWEIQATDRRCELLQLGKFSVILSAQ